jgi:hypothetical protein
MSTTMIKHLVLKDWYFQRWPLAGYLVAGAVALALIAGGTNGSFYAGTVLLITVMVTAGISVVITTVIGERTEHTLPFVMSLPISPIDYATAKIVANLTIFLVPWTMLTAGTLVLFAMGAGGMIPLATLLLVEMFASYCLILMTAIATESQGWTLAVMGVSNLFLQAYLYLVTRMPGIASTMRGKVAVWDRGAIALLIVEILLSFLFLGLAYVMQARKKDFL